DLMNQIGLYDKKLHDKQIYNERLVSDFEDAIKNNDFMVYYQPKYSVLHGEPMLSSAEALVRWKHPELGMISPGDFIPLFESNGLIQKLDQFVWKSAASQIKEWKDKFGLTIPISVNVSRIDIYNPELEEVLAAIVETNGLKTNELFLEITESAYADDASRLIEVVNNLRERGFEIEMDDFGTGYSSLNMLTAIPIDALKMDMSFVRNMLEDDMSLKLVQLIIDIASFLDVPVIAEGVETKEQLDTLIDLNCDLIQGYYFSKPVPANEFEEFIKG
ncbi:MAG: EAL domain-containing protein, partial [Lachnospiraceae bacterium]|nr:EAL domain-containing protein [Lachnospiraceae bacterium]